MKKIFLLIPLLFLLGGCVATNYSNEDLGASVLRVYQGGTGLSSVPVGECLKGNGTAALTSGACGTGTGGSSNWQELFTNAITPTSTTAGIFVNASSTFNSTLRVNSGLIVNSNATTTGNSLIGNTLYVKDSNVGIGTANPNSKLEIYNSAGAGTITMSGNGSDAYNFDSMTMYDTGGKYWAIHHRNTDGGLNNLLFEHYNGSTYNGYMTINPDGHILAPNLRAASLNASSTLISTLNFTNATGTNLHLTELCLTNDCKTAWPTGGVASWDDLTNKPATSTVLNLLDTQNRIAVLNATTTNIGTLKVYTALDFPANSITSAMMTTGWNSLHNATTTYPGFQSQFNTALNATTTWAGFTPAWNTLFNATTTWSAFDTNWNRKANATTTYPGFASQFATAYNATTTQTNFTPNWNAVFNATTTWAGFTSNFNTLLNATTTLDLSTFSVGSGDAFTINSSGVASSTNTTTIGSMKCYKSPNQESHTTTCISI